jgi:hypothetical protein
MHAILIVQKDTQTKILISLRMRQKNSRGE